MRNRDGKRQMRELGGEGGGRKEKWTEVEKGGGGERRRVKYLLSLLGNQS